MRLLIDLYTLPRVTSFAAARIKLVCLPGIVQGLSSKRCWKNHIERAAKILENNVLKQQLGEEWWSQKCSVCDTDICESHICGKRHFNTLVDKMKLFDPTDPKRLPEQTIAEHMDHLIRPWVQPFETKSGTYLFNHLTGGLEFRENWKPAPLDHPPPVLPEGVRHSRPELSRGEDRHLPGEVQPTLPGEVRHLPEVSRPPPDGSLGDPLGNPRNVANQHTLTHSDCMSASIAASLQKLGHDLLQTREDVQRLGQKVDRLAGLVEGLMTTDV